MDPTPPSGEPSVMPTRPLILVADDSRVVTELLKRWLQQEGAEVITAADGPSAHQLGLERPINLAIIDQVMPGRVGAEVVQSWRSQGVTAPVIMVSGVEDRRMRADALELGADVYLYKPVSHTELMTEVRRLLNPAPPEADT